LTYKKISILKIILFYFIILYIKNTFSFSTETKILNPTFRIIPLFGKSNSFYLRIIKKKLALASLDFTISFGIYLLSFSEQGKIESKLTEHLLLGPTAFLPFNSQNSIKLLDSNRLITYAYN
jgi:hypothetical protein